MFMLQIFSYNFLGYTLFEIYILIPGVSAHILSLAYKHNQYNTPKNGCKLHNDRALL